VRRNEPIARHAAWLTRLLDDHGAAALDAAIAEALDRGAVSAASVEHLLDQRARARHTLPAIPVVLPEDPRVRDLRVAPHPLAQYDALAQETSDDDDTSR